jgi:hypothetical protein
VPLLLDPTTYSQETLRELLLEQREGLTEYLALFRDPPARVRDPASLRTAVDLLQDTVSAIDQLNVPTAEPAALAAGANLGYSVMLAAIDLWKSHADVSKVPKPSAPPQT